ncbi:hypothetical protein KKB44_02960 [Candidatus Micrarchaeota archaeon]|nr:hypothetical protein [Candidatus Micrarchaeota archaeon]
MRREILAILLLSALVNATIDQSYEQVVKRDGSSVIIKTMEMDLFITELGDDALTKIAETCAGGQSIKCNVNNTTITIEKEFSASGYYWFTTEYTLFSIDHTLTVNKIPTDGFSNALDQLLEDAGVINKTGSQAQAIDLLDNETNAENAKYLRMFKANITYTIHMPGEVKEAYAGSVVPVNGVQFDLIDLMEESQPIIVKSSETNYANILLIAMAIVLGALALSFFGEKRRRKEKK